MKTTERHDSHSHFLPSNTGKYPHWLANKLFRKQQKSPNGDHVVWMSVVFMGIAQHLRSPYHFCINRYPSLWKMHCDMNWLPINFDKLEQTALRLSLWCSRYEILWPVCTVENPSDDYLVIGDTSWTEEVIEQTFRRLLHPLPSRSNKRV